PAPIQALVGLKDDKLVVRTIGLESISPVTKVVDGRNVTSYIWKEKVNVASFDLSVVKICDLNGKRIESKEISKLLNNEIVALIAKDGIEVDPLHLQLFKEGTLLFLLPLPNPAPTIALPTAPDTAPMPPI